jgi:hypothetical protein
MRAVVSSTLAILVITTAAEAGAAANAGGPALVAVYSNYDSGEPTGGPACFNVAARMPSGRQFACRTPQYTRTATGRYTITVDNAAPMPTSSVDDGYLIFVQAVGSSAHCFEASTTWTGGPWFRLTSNIRCVAPSGSSSVNNDVDTDFAWMYRTDNADFPQNQPWYRNNFAYARINRSSGSPEPSQTFNILMDNEVIGTRTSTGRYTVVFRYLNPLHGSAAPESGINNIIVQKTCSADTSASCRRAVCIPYGWTPGTFSIDDTTVNVRCYGPDGNPRDTDFRVFAGDETVSSQCLGSWDGGGIDMGMGWHFAWFNFAHSTSNICYPESQFLFRGQHETPFANYPTLPGQQVCKTGAGAYAVSLGALAPYHADDPIPFVSGRATGGGYCNPFQFECNSGNCDPGGGQPSRLMIRCYDRTGALSSTGWNMAMIY